jgi:hypothetical protein
LGEAQLRQLQHRHESLRRILMPAVVAAPPVRR